MQPHCEMVAGALRVVLVPCEAESVAVGLFVDVGSRHETAAEAGASHFLEHMLFKGTAKRSALDITRAVEGRGGNFNACTGEEQTCYYLHLPSEYLSEAVDILSDMYLNASLAEEEFVREREVIIEEIKMYADEPDSVAMENLQRTLFPVSALGAPIAGSPKSLLAMKSVDLRKYFKAHYRLDNTIVVVAGDFDEAAALKQIAKAFAPGKRRRKGKSPRQPSPFAGRVKSEVSKLRDISQVQLALGYRTFGFGDPRKYAATVMDAILGRGMSSRLFQEVREKRGLSYDIASRMQFFRDAGMFTISAGLDQAKAARALMLIDRELDRICRYRVSAAELARTKEFLIGNFRLAHEKVVAKLFFYGQVMLSFGRLMTPAEQVERIREVTSEEVRATAAVILNPNNRAVSWVRPKGMGEHS